MGFSRGQLSLEFLLAVLLILIVFSSVFSLYTANSIAIRQSALRKEGALAAQLLGSSINRLAAASNVDTLEVQLPDGSYTLSLKDKRVEVSSAGSEYSYPLITESASLQAPANAGDMLLLKKHNGGIYVSEAR